MDIIMSHISKKCCWQTSMQHYLYDKQVYLLVLIFLSLWTSPVYSQCEIVSNEQATTVECDISFSMQPADPLQWQGENRDIANQTLTDFADAW